VQRSVKVLAIAVLVATVLIVSSTAAFGRPLRGGLPQQNERLCEKLAGYHPRFAETAPEPPSEDGPTAACWHVSPGLGRASEVVPASTRTPGT